MMQKQQPTRSTRKKPSLKWRLIRIILLCWLLPVIILAAGVVNVATSNISEQTINSYKQRADFSASLVRERLDTAVEIARTASYDNVLKSNYQQYRQYGKRNELYTGTQKFLSSRFRADERFRYAIMWYWEDPVELSSYLFNESLGARTESIETYWQQDHAKVMDEAASLDTRIAFLNCDGRIYLVRNVMDGSLRQMAVLVLALNEKFFFGDYDLLSWQQGYDIYINGTEMHAGGPPAKRSVTEIYSHSPKPIYFSNELKTVVYGMQRGIAYSINYVIDVAQPGGYKQIGSLRMALGAMLLILLPLILFVIRFFYANVSNPVEQLLVGAREIEIGNFGYQLCRQSYNREFEYLEQSFNEMSLQLEELFFRIYDEELALRDARIKALQSQINPHFLNNTLEIINWEARMSGNIKVGKMIEALSTMLDAAMARDGRKTVRLAEEMMYVDAYLYIISERLGKRLTISKDVDSTLLEYKVPRLILQPIIENAVEHGIVPRQHGEIGIRVAREEASLVLQVLNDGEMSEQDAAEVVRLLSDDSNEPLTSSRSIGIRNVHQRLRILYGTGSGLTITPYGGERVAATIRIALEHIDES